MNKAHGGGSSGGHLPAPGNPSPPPAGAIPSAETKAADQNSGGALLNPPVAASAGSAATGLGVAQALGLPVADPGQTRTQSGDAAGMTNALAPNAQGTVANAQGTVAAGAALPAAARANTAAINAATSAPSSVGGTAATAANPVATTNSDATAQTADAAAMSAAAAGASASKDAGFAGAANSTADDSAAPTAQTLAQDAGHTNGAPVPALAGAAAPQAAAAAATATAALDAHANTALAIASTSDKHARDGSGDSLLPGASGGVAGAAQLSINDAGATDATPTPTLKVTVGVETPEFGQSLADRVSYMVDSNLNGAKLQVNPPQLGPIEVRIAVQGDHAQVWFTSHSAVTRDALESSAPKLREMLGMQGFGQVSVDISHRSFQERSAFAQPYDWTPSASRGASVAPVSAAPASISRISSGAVDAYA
jgi:flagellar hook-length control protein FliK